jgi:hypothetical protein
MKIVSLLKYPETPPLPIITVVTFGTGEQKLLAIINENRSTKKRPNRLLIFIEIYDSPFFFFYDSKYNSRIGNNLSEARKNIWTSEQNRERLIHITPLQGKKMGKWGNGRMGKRTSYQNSKLPNYQTTKLSNYQTTSRL